MAILPKPHQRSALHAALSVFALVSLLVIGGGSGPGSSSASFRRFGNQAVPHPHDSDDWLIVPGTRIGALALGDAETKISQLFPKPSIGQFPGPPGCGTGYLVGLLKDARHPGFLRVFAMDGKVVEIEANRAHYHTAEGIASNSYPEEVRLHYKGLKSYLFLGGTYEALNMGPLVVWAHEEKGIAFSFVHRSRSESTFSVSSIIVFKPGHSFCEEDAVVGDPQRWRKLPPDSLGETKEAAQANRLTHQFLRASVAATRMIFSFRE